MRWPSGDQRGPEEDAPSCENNSSAFEPSASLSQIPEVLVRSEKKAIRFPSAEYRG